MPIETQAQEARFRLAEPERLQGALGALDALQAAPRDAVVGLLDRVARGGRIGPPVQQQRAEFLRAAVVDRQRGLRVAA